MRLRNVLRRKSDGALFRASYPIDEFKVDEGFCMMLGMAAGTRSGYYFERIQKRKGRLLSMLLGPWVDASEVWEPKSSSDFEVVK